MKNNLTDFFRDDTGAFSMMRGIYFLCFVLTAAVVIAIIIIAAGMEPVILDNNGIKTVVNPDTSVIKELVFLAALLLGIPTTGKFVSTFGERTVTSEKTGVVK